MEENSMAPKTGRKNQLIILLVIVVLLGFAIMLSQKVQEKQIEQIKMQETVIQNDAVTQQIQSQSSSDDASSIEADLQATNIDALDQ